MRLRTLAAIVATAIFVSASWNGDDDDNGPPTDTDTTEEQPTPTDPDEEEGASPSTVNPSFPGTENQAHGSPHCYYRSGTLLVGPTDEDRLDVASVDRALRVGGFDPLPAPTDTLGDVQVYENLSGDVLDMAAVINESEAATAAPNLVMSFAPEWKFSPGGDPQQADDPRPPARPTPSATIVRRPQATVVAVDTGFDANTWPARWPVDGWQVPPAVNDVTDGPVAGHGSFVAGVIGQLTPEVEVVVERPDIVMSAPGGVPSTDDAAVARAIESLQGRTVDVLNLSLGTYDCSDAPGFSEGVEPVATREALEALLTASPETIVTAAAGNDAHGDGPRFYPAAWALDTSVLGNGIVSVGTAAGEFSNWGPWVEVSATGTFVGYRPGQQAGWYTWSGTSFAAPCVAATIAAQVDDGNRITAADAWGGLAPSVPIGTFAASAEEIEFDMVEC